MAGVTVHVHAEGLSQSRLVYSNLGYINDADFETLLAGTTDAIGSVVALPVRINDTIIHVTARSAVERGKVQLNTFQRKAAGVAFTDDLELSVVPSSALLPLSSMHITISAKAGPRTLKVDAGQLAGRIVSEYSGHVFRQGQEFCILQSEQPLKLTVTALSHVLLGDGDAGAGAGAGTGAGAGAATAASSPLMFGAINRGTAISFARDRDAPIEIVGGTSKTSARLFDASFNFESLGIGGLNKEFGIIFRRAFASRLYPGLMRDFGLQHVRGMLLYGPPGCGKTLIARKIGEALHAREPKKVNGPEILNKFVGQSEENIRALFKDAEEDQKAHGDDSELHIIIFDEIDAICKQRGSTRDGTGVGDNIVNQLLTKLDGLDGLNNILVIGMTNRRDLIDEALTRPGRMEICLEIGLPDSDGRVSILNIHTAKIKSTGRLAEDVDMPMVAASAKNYTGAELMGLVRDATTFAMQKAADPADPTRAADPATIKLTMGDFTQALAETTPQFGTKESELAECMHNGIICYGTEVDSLLHKMRLFAKQVATSEHTPLLTVLLQGQPGSGKTAISAKSAMDSLFPYKKRITADTLLGYSEVQKAGAIQKVFEDAYKTPLSCIILDDIERIIDYVPLGQRFSNTVLQTLLVLIKRPPPDGRKVHIIGTTSNTAVLSEMGIVDAFNIAVNVPLVSSADEVSEVLCHLAVADQAVVKHAAGLLCGSIGIKKLLVVVEMARMGGELTSDMHEIARLLVHTLHAQIRNMEAPGGDVVDDGGAWWSAFDVGMLSELDVMPVVTMAECSSADGLVQRMSFEEQPPEVVYQTLVVGSNSSQDTKTPLRVSVHLPLELSEAFVASKTPVEQGVLSQHITVQLRRFDLAHLEVFCMKTQRMQQLHAPEALFELSWSPATPELLYINIHRKTLPISANLGGTPMVLAVLFRRCVLRPCERAPGRKRQKCTDTESAERHVAGHVVGLAVSRAFFIRSKMLVVRTPARPPLRKRAKPPRAFIAGQLRGPDHEKDTQLSTLLAGIVVEIPKLPQQPTWKEE